MKDFLKKCGSWRRWCESQETPQHKKVVFVKYTFSSWILSGWIEKVLRREKKKKWGGDHCSKTLTERGDDCFDFVFGFPRCEIFYKIKRTNRLLTEAWNQEKRGLPFGVNMAMRINKDERAVRAVGIYRVITIVKDGVHDVWQRLSFF